MRSGRGAASSYRRIEAECFVYGRIEGVRAIRVFRRDSGSFTIPLTIREFGCCGLKLFSRRGYVLVGKDRDLFASCFRNFLTWAWAVCSVAKNGNRLCIVGSSNIVVSFCADTTNTKLPKTLRSFLRGPLRIPIVRSFLRGPLRIEVSHDFFSEDHYDLEIHKKYNLKNMSSAVTRSLQ